MALTEQDALKKANELIANSNAARARHEAMCGLWLCYTYGPQWAQFTKNANLSGNSLRYLRPVINPRRRDVRVAINHIQARVQKINSRLMPRELIYNTGPASRASNDMVASLVANARMKQQTDDARALTTIRRASLWRCVLGSAVIRRTMESVGEPVTVRGADGKPSVGPNGRERTIKTFAHKWVVCPPYEFIRDASARTTDFEDEEIIGHECPRTVEWVKRKFGVDVKAKATMGQLLEFQQFLYRATGQTYGQGFGESKAPAVMVSEWWFKDTSQNGKNRWPFRMLAYRDTRGETASDRQLVPLEFGPNGYYHLPLHHITYDQKLISPWGLGIPPKCIPTQDAINIGMTSMLRASVHHGSPTWVIEDNSLVDGVREGLNPRADKAVVYFSSAKRPPTRLESAQVDSTVRQILADSPVWLDAMLNTSPVQSGQAVKRGEAFKAYEMRKNEADTPLTSILDEDEVVFDQLLTGTMQDILKSDTPKSLLNRLSHQFTQQQILTLVEQDPSETLAGVKIVKETLRPKTTLETKDDFMSAIQSEMVDPITARRSMLVDKGITFDVREKRAYDHQVMEISSLLNGEEVEVWLGQEHEMHQYAIELEMDSQQFNAYSDEQQQALQDHWTEHQEKKQIRAQLDEPLPQMPEEPLPPEAAPPGEALPGLGDLPPELLGQQAAQPPLNAAAGALPTPPLGGLGEGIVSGGLLPQTGAVPTAPIPSAPVGAGTF
jgi:hypothetical protein